MNTFLNLRTPNLMLSIILVNWNGYLDTLYCIESLILHNKGPFNIIVVDNGSTDQSLCAFRSWANNKFKLTNKTYEYIILN